MIHYASQFRCYEPYMKGYDRSQKVLNEFAAKNEAFSNWLDWNKACFGSDLRSLLIQPVQRLPRVSFFL